MSSRATRFGCPSMEGSRITMKTEKGMEGFIHGVGHGFGLDIHEPPNIGRTSHRLKTNSVIAVEPGLYYFGVGAVRLEDIVVVHEQRCETITDFPEILEIP